MRKPPTHEVYTSNNIIPSRAWAAGPQTTGNPGNDIAVLFLDPPGNAIPGSKPGPVLELAQIEHPSLASPCPTSGCGDDANGGTYDPQLGMVGWATSDAPRFRQIAFDSEFHHFPGKPDDRGQYWRHVQGSIHDDPGDSGGPLFVRRPVPGRPGLFFRDVIGVLSDVRHNGIGNDYDEWVDITRGAIAGFISQALLDPTPRGPRWRAQHPGLIWIGDVDYTGPCDTALDHDCDHIYDIHDNCPTVFNPDQADIHDTGRGDACPPPPSPKCTIAFSCTAAIFTPPDFTVTCTQSVDFFTGFDSDSRAFVRSGTALSGTAADEIGYVWGCVPGTLNCAGLSTFKGITEWCAAAPPPPRTCAQCNSQRCCVDPNAGPGRNICVQLSRPCPKLN